MWLVRLESSATVRLHLSLAWSARHVVRALLPEATSHTTVAVVGATAVEMVRDSARERMSCTGGVSTSAQFADLLSVYLCGYGRRFLLLARLENSAFVCRKCPSSMGNHGGRNPHAVSRKKADESHLGIKLRRVFLIGSHWCSMEIIALPHSHM